MISTRTEWMDVLQEISLLPESPIKQKDGKWQVADRKESWRSLGPRVFDAHLERITKLAVHVLREKNPQLELPKEERFMGSITGKVLKYSPPLRIGLAQTLALLGSSPEALTSCSQGKAEATAALAVREILYGADWTRWASLNSYLPTLAEAAPEEFLSAVEHALQDANSPFIEIFKLEETGIFGQNYMTGLLWALETLAWSQDHLQRVIVVLGELAAIDPGGNWVNRPKNSLTDIFLPWHPQTCASIAKRKSAIKALLREQPAVGWRLLISLLPKLHSSTSGCHKPSWRKLIPDQWSEKVTTEEYWEQVGNYAEMALDIALADYSRLIEIAEHFPNMPAEGFARLIQHLGSDAVLSLPESDRLPLWEALVKLVGKHRKFPDAKWVMQPQPLNQIEAASMKLAPNSPELLYHRLFSSRDFELFEDAHKIPEEQTKLDLKRQSAVLDILKVRNIAGVLDFARQVVHPGVVGFTLGCVEWACADESLLPEYLDKEDDISREFIRNFIRGRVCTKGWEWADNILSDKWTLQQKVMFFTFLPFTHETWQRVQSKLGHDAGVYWEKVNVQPYGPQPNLLDAVEKLLQFGRPRAALGCLDRLVFEKAAIPPKVVVRTLMASVDTTEELTGFDMHSVVELVQWLQENPSTDPDDLFRAEWAYLPLLDGYSGGRPKTLEMRLASDSSFFCEVIAAAFKSEMQSAEAPQPNEQQKNIARMAYGLLNEWQTVPGARADGTFDGQTLAKWLSEVVPAVKKSGHFRVAMSHIGQVLAHAPADPSGLWIHVSAAEALNAKESDAMRSGFMCKQVNMRGVHGYSAGEEERQIAAGFHQKAEQLEERGYHRIATTMRDLAKGYERDANREAQRNPLEA